jgi:hypothetical protein
VETLAELPFIGDQVVRLSHDQGARSGPAERGASVDACSGALEMLNPPMESWGLYELYRRQAETAAERNKPQPVQSMPQPGSVEWFEAMYKKLKG